MERNMSDNYDDSAWGWGNNFGTDADWSHSTDPWSSDSGSFSNGYND